MKRKIYKRLLEWKEKDQGACALLLDGARRVGKSYIAQQFGQNEYRSNILIDFAHLPKEVQEIFEHDFTDLELFFNKLSAYYRVQLYPRETLFVFDEVQQFPKARELVKYLVADGRYDYLETGSLISLRTNVEHIVIPSEEEHVEMFPMDFEEFLWAMGDETTIPFLRDCFEHLRPLGQAVHRRVMNDFRQYMLVGGMPQAVEVYVKTKNFEETDRIKKRILQLYRADVTKFARGYEAKVLAIFDEMPAQLAKTEKKYKLSDIDKTARFRDYENAFIWLSEAMIANNCYNATEPTVGLSMSTEYTTRKSYMADTGLLVSHSFMEDSYMDNELYRDILLDRLHVNEGMLMENIVAQELRSSGHKLYFYSRVDKNHRENNMEIDFLIRNKRKICPVEVKSGNYRKHSSLDKFREKFRRNIGQPYILYTRDIVVKEDIVHLPLYMAMFL
ncbi:ATP-binding protein [Ihubacter sp. rT4E-8]|uniref:ATP-binding protein n=1 Tax=Ihubacter sp. rT4E-8 TaxID=3242369 RepID=UPI003CE817EF